MGLARGENIHLLEKFCFDRRSGNLLLLDCGTPVAIGSRALDVLGVLIDRAGELVSKDEIMKVVWPDTVVEDANLTVQISALRRILDSGGSEVGSIQTVPGRGYRFVGGVTRQERKSVSPPLLAPASNTGDADIVVSSSPMTVGPISVRNPWRKAGKRRGFWIGIVALFVMVIGAAMFRAADFSWLSTSGPPRLSIVVLPFANLSEDRGQQYFADGITDDLTTDLSQIVDMVVISRNTAFAYKAKGVEARQVGRDLGVRYVLEGSVRRSGNEVRINAQLIDAETNAHVWAERFDREVGDLFTVQSEITGRIANSLNANLALAAAREAEYADKPDAHDLLMRGMALWRAPSSPEVSRRALEFFERALALDPQSLRARLAVADSLIALVLDGWSSDPDGDTRRAEELLAAVIESEPNSARAYFALGRLRRSQHRLVESRLALERTIALDRNHTGALVQLAVTLTYLGDPEAALAPLQKRTQLDPHGTNTAFSFFVLGRVHLLLGHVDQAIDFLSQSRTANPRVWYVHFYLAAALGYRGNVAEARDALSEGIRLRPEAYSMARLYAIHNYDEPGYVTLRQKTIDVGLRRAGMPDV